MMKKLALILLPALLAVSCTGDKARISGRLAGRAEQMLYLQSVQPYNTQIVDSAKTDALGEFRFRVSIGADQPQMFNLMCDSEIIPLIVSRGERVRICAVGNISQNYSVENSPESELVCQLNGILTAGAFSLDSLSNLYARSEAEARAALAREYTERYINIKRRHLRFVVENASSLAAVYALYQSLPGDEQPFGDNDRLYFSMVADSVAGRYPDSQYLKALRQMLERDSAAGQLRDMIFAQAAAPASYPDLRLPDMYGRQVQLSSLDGNVILLDFWSGGIAACNVNNAELKELYSKYHAAGFEVYQVSLDTDRAGWITMVQQQELPWNSLCDFRGYSGPAFRLYNITSLPSNILIDRAGNIAAKNIYGSQLEKQLEKLL